MRGRGFTAVELAMVLPILGVIATCVVTAFLIAVAEMRTATLLADLKSDTSRAAYRIFRTAQKARLSADNRGLLYSDGSSLRWEADRLVLHPARGPAQSLLKYPVHTFLVTRRDGILSLHLELLASLRWRGEPQIYRVAFDDPFRADAAP